MEAPKVEKLVFIGDLEPYEQEKEGTRKRQYRRLLEQADRYRSLEHPKESTTYMGIAILNLALAYRLSRKEEYLKDAKRFMETVLSYEKWGMLIWSMWICLLPGFSSVFPWATIG